MGPNRGDSQNRDGAARSITNCVPGTSELVGKDLGTIIRLDASQLIRWFGPLGHLWMLVCHAILDGVGVVVFRVQFSEEWC